MDHAANPDFLTDITDALDWWRRAGVDFDFVDEPQSWLAVQEEALDAKRRFESSQPARVQVSQPEPAHRIDLDALPTNLEDFRRWWLSEAMLDGGNTRGRVPPRGSGGARLMVIVDEPEAGDQETLLSGPQGRFIDAMLPALGVTREDIYVASAIPRHTPAADWSAATQLGIGEILAHHIALVQPERLFIPSGNILPLIGHESPQAPAALRRFNQEEASIPMLAAWGLSSLVQPQAKKTLWRAWLEWTAA
jgi:Uracil-DNA glycosylase